MAGPVPLSQVLSPQATQAGDRASRDISLGPVLGRCYHQLPPPLCGPTDVDECEGSQNRCLGGECKNTEGSYQCLCPRGFQLANGTVCEGECPMSPPSGTGDSEYLHPRDTPFSSCPCRYKRVCWGGTLCSSWRMPQQPGVLLLPLCTRLCQC